MSGGGTQVVVSAIPNCDLDPNHGIAYADAKIPSGGQWAFLCWSCFIRLECVLGRGKGQRLIRG